MIAARAGSNLRCISVWFVLLTLVACTRDTPQIVVITATFPPSDELSVVQPVPSATANSAVSAMLIDPTPDPPRAVTSDVPETVVVQPGDTLSAIAQRYNLSIEAVLSVNTLINPNILSVGQVLNLPQTAGFDTPATKLIADGRFVRGPGSANFDIIGFVQTQPGYIAQATDIVISRLANGATIERTRSAAEVVQQIALEYSIDPRVLLALLEYRAGWLSLATPTDDKLTHPLISPEASVGIDRSGLYKQLAWAANELNRGFYGWRYRNWTALELADRTRVNFASGLNAGTVALQYFLSLNNPVERWQGDIGPEGFIQVYQGYFGDPFVGAVDPLVPEGLQQPPFALPFARGETWFFTGGPHGGWGAGSAWGALDFAPPDDRPPGESLCYTSQSWVLAVAEGVIARSGDGVAVLDLDGDGDEGTGWSILYLHLADDGLIETGKRVAPGGQIGRASCAGGFSTATHLHIARRYNGEWIPADCTNCTPGEMVPAFNLAGWRAYGINGQEYQGVLELQGTRVQAEQGRQNPINRINW